MRLEILIANIGVRFLVLQSGFLIRLQQVLGHLGLITLSDLIVLGVILRFLDYLLGLFLSNQPINFFDNSGCQSLPVLPHRLFPSSIWLLWRALLSPLLCSFLLRCPARD